MKTYWQERVVIIGLGITGISCVNFFRTRGITPQIMDTRLSPPGLDKLPANVPCYLGKLNKKWLLNATLIIISPGVSLENLTFLEKTGIEIISDIELFCREVTEPIVAISGTNGKSTVTRMVGNMAACAGWQVGVGGNIGLPALMLLDTPSHFYVLELSSFQLETTYSLKATAATILNVSDDHIDRYPFGLQHYRTTKLKIYHNAKVCIVNSDDPLTFPIFRKKNYCVSFGSNADSDYHLDEDDGRTYLMRHNERLLDCQEMNIVGRHNYINALAALALADVVGIPHSSSLKALRQFHGLSHRCDVILERNGVRWINDSKSTNLASLKAALNGIEVKGTLHLLLGGNSKSSDFSSLSSFLQNKKIQLYCFGQDGKKLALLRPDSSIFIETLQEAMHIIGHRVKKGDLVLLSPACASFDQFKNFKIRGEVFTDLAHKVG
ncbi:UDP-N-acetylmuramoyl-L-alanine--D-glutamate ligase [Candidatus Curculioniphilus buchneri]|uniref:UDP-N-acetylmuramoyl-L-alanine--D-glutamate ligase n=1 Tax=Candidatus Curculioniphilus buchneri TaxID=690594 RepID=UPI00376EC65F